MNYVNLVAFLICLFYLPVFTVGLIRKAKAQFQNRVGPSLFQPLFNIIKLFGKSETVSKEASWIFRWSTVINMAAVIVLAFLVPWLPFRPLLPGDDIFLVVYLLALARFFAIIAALDTGSAFAAFGASREATLSLLTEPGIVLSLVALGLAAHTSDLCQIFAIPHATGQLKELALWLLAGTGVLLASLVELSRMPIDDPTTHLELTMVHEAMVIENSGPNLALVELTYSLRLAILFGLAGQCFLHGLLLMVKLPFISVCLLSVLLILAVALLTAVIESFAVKLAWRKNPDFIAYSLTMSLLACLAAIMKGPTA
jgi:formate hydrogenlyase subunit 4